MKIGVRFLRSGRIWLEEVDANGQAEPPRVVAKVEESTRTYGRGKAQRVEAFIVEDRYVREDTDDGEGVTRYCYKHADSVVIGHAKEHSWTTTHPELGRVPAFCRRCGKTAPLGPAADARTCPGQRWWT